jgi:glycosyltransferase involved in cell wall biosynthesis
MTPPLRVTHVVFDLDGGGLESFVAAMARHHATHPDRVRMSIVTLSGRAGRVGESVRDIADAFVTLRPRRMASMVFPLGLIRVLRRLRPDVVHLHSGAWYKPALAARIAGVRRVIYTEHGRVHADPWHSRALDRLAARLTDAIVTVSDALQSYMVHQVGVSPTRVRTITNGVDVSRFSPAEGPRTDNQRLVVGSVGRLATVKGQDVLIEAVALLNRMPNLPPFAVVIAGDGPARPQLEALIETRGLGHTVRLAGWSDDPARLYRSFDLYVLPSRSEGMSISLLEAMASGVAPVVTRVGSNAELVGPALQNQVVPPEDPAALADCLGDTLRSATRRQGAAAEALRRARADYDWRSTMAAYDALYYQHSLVDAAGGRVGAVDRDAVGAA